MYDQVQLAIRQEHRSRAIHNVFEILKLKYLLSIPILALRLPDAWLHLSFVG